MNFKIIAPLLSVLIITSCSNSEKKVLQKTIADKDAQITMLQEQIDHYQSSNQSLSDRLADLSVINMNDAESIKESLQSINNQFDYISSLSDEIKAKDSLNQVLASRLKNTLFDWDDNDIQIEVKGNAVYVSISDNLLFNSGSANLSQSANAVLEKVSRIINDNTELNVLVEGHTDNVPISNNKYQDNWDLSVLRATSVVRALQTNYYVSPDRLTAAGRSEFIPKSENETRSGRSQNRRTEIIITPKLDQFFKLLKTPELMS